MESNHAQFIRTSEHRYFVVWKEISSLVQAMGEGGVAGDRGTKVKLSGGSTERRKQSEGTQRLLVSCQASGDPVHYRTLYRQDVIVAPTQGRPAPMGVNSVQ